MSKTIKGRLNNLDKIIQEKWKERYWAFIIRNEDEIYRYYIYISMSPYITMEIIENNPDKSWDISQNPNITMKMIEQHLN